jgi:hypothetical protein
MEEMYNLELEDIALERLNANNIVGYWNFVYKYDFYDKMKIKSKIYKYVRDNKLRLVMDDNLISNKMLLYETCINQTEQCETTNEAAKKGHLECLKYLHENGRPWDADTCECAAENGHIECLKYAHKNGCKWNANTCAYAAENGNLECLRYAHENGCKWNANTCTYAALNGQLECVKYAHENGCPWNAKTCSWTAERGQLECLKYLHENGCEWNEWTCAYAAENGSDAKQACLALCERELLERSSNNPIHSHLECLKYAHEHGCLWNKNTCSWAAEKGQLECLKYAHENGCPWDAYTCAYAAENGSDAKQACLKYACDQKCPGYEQYIDQIAKN